MELILSAPTTTTFLYRPLSISVAPVVRLYRKPLQAANRSKPQALTAPIFSQTRLAVEGKSMSGVTVPTIMQSNSEGRIPLFSQSCNTAGTQRSEVPLSTPFRILLSEMPVLVRFQACEEF